LSGIGGALGTLGLMGLLLTVFSLVLTDFFDTMGTVIGISEQMDDVAEDGSVEKIRPILLVDSLAAVAGGAVGASSATTYVESAAGVGVGGRTGLTSVVTGLLFFLAMFFSPIAGIVPPQATAPALILVGFLMSSGIRHIDWDDPGLALPALATMLAMPLTYSVTNGIGAGFVGYVAMRIFQGRRGEVHPLMWLVAGAFALYFLLPWLQGLM
jgi:AGZA family xanthine/uracil permease-like MFS transporter